MRFRMMFVLAAALALTAVAVDPAGAAEGLTDVHWWTAAGHSPGDLVDQGRATLVRHEGSVSMELVTTGLVPGNAYTVWWAIFNAPERCTGLVKPPAPAACGDPDWASPLAEPATVWAAGGVAPASGGVTFAGSLQVGDVSHDIFAWEHGLTDPGGSEIWLVVRDHGPAIEGSDQTTTFNGGCMNYLPGAPGMPGTYQCENVQLATYR
jgi:hypothetical protein